MARDGKCVYSNPQAMEYKRGQLLMNICVTSKIPTFL